MQQPRAASSSLPGLSKAGGNLQNSGQGQANRWRKRANKRPQGPLPRQLEALHEEQSRSGAQRSRPSSVWAGLTITSSDHAHKKQPPASKTGAAGQKRRTKQIRPAEQCHVPLSGQRSSCDGSPAASMGNTMQRAEKDREPEGHGLGQESAGNILRPQQPQMGLPDAQISSPDRIDHNSRGQAESIKHGRLLGQEPDIPGQHRQLRPLKDKNKLAETMDMCGSSTPGPDGDNNMAHRNLLKQPCQSMVRGRAPQRAMLQDSQATCDSSASPPQQSQHAVPCSSAALTKQHQPVASSSPDGHAAELNWQTDLKHQGGQTHNASTSLAGPVSHNAKDQIQANQYFHGSRQIVRSRAKAIAANRTCANVSSSYLEQPAGLRYLHVHDDSLLSMEPGLEGQAALEAAGLASPTASHGASPTASPAAPETSAINPDEALPVAAHLEEPSHMAQCDSHAGADNMQLLASQTAHASDDMPKAMQHGSFSHSSGQQSAQAIPETLLNTPMLHVPGSSNSHLHGQSPASTLALPHDEQNGDHEKAEKQTMHHLSLEAQPDWQHVQVNEIQAQTAAAESNADEPNCMPNRESQPNVEPAPATQLQQAAAHVAAEGSVHPDMQPGAGQKVIAAETAAPDHFGNEIAATCTPRTPEALSDCRAPSGSVCLELPGHTVRSIELTSR